MSQIIINKSIVYISFCYRVHCNKEFSNGNSKYCCEFQEFNEKKRYFAVIFAQRDFFLKTLTKCNCSAPPPPSQDSDVKDTE